MHMKKINFIMPIVLSVFSAAFAQEALKSTEEEYYDFLSLTGAAERPTLNYRTLSDSEWQVTDEKHLWKDNNLGTKRTLYESDATETNWFTAGIDRSVKLKLYGPEWFNSYNTKAPYGQNDGALWQGKGYNTSLTAGARLEAFGFEATFKPQVSWSQNREFDYMPGVYGSEYSYFWKGNIDLVQRYGDSSFWTFDWGDTEARYTWHNFTAGFGFQSPWLGPAWLNPMLGSNNAGTYPKFDIGLRKTEIHMPWTGWTLGEIEGRAWLGYLTESDYFDNDSTNDHRQLTGFSVAYSPSIIPGFTIGANKICINNWKDKSIKYLNPLYSTNGSQTGDKIDEDQKMSLFAEWRFPQVGFEVYGELGVDDYSAQKTSNPFHTAIYTVGAKQCIPVSPKYGIFGEIIFEWNNFEMSQDFQLNWHYMGYYAHGSIQQGYTQNGQILGAGSGYFGNSQYLGFRIYYPKGYTTMFFHRSRPDNNYIYNIGLDTNMSDWEGKGHHDQWAQNKTYKIIGIQTLLYATESLQISAGVDNIFINYPFWNDSKIGDRNIRVCLGLKYNL